MKTKFPPVSVVKLVTESWGINNGHLHLAVVQLDLWLSFFGGKVSVPAKKQKQKHKQKQKPFCEKRKKKESPTRCEGFNGEGADILSLWCSLEVELGLSHECPHKGGLSKP